MSDQPTEFTHGIVAISTVANPDGSSEILHFCGYSNQPTQADFDGLKAELESSPEFGLIGENYNLQLADQAVLEQFKGIYADLLNNGEAKQTSNPEAS